MSYLNQPSILDVGDTVVIKNNIKISPSSTVYSSYTQTPFSNVFYSIDNIAVSTIEQIPSKVSISSPEVNIDSSLIKLNNSITINKLSSYYNYSNLGMNTSFVGENVTGEVKLICFLNQNIPSFSGNGGTWFLLNGQSISRSLFPKLYLMIGTTYGSGDGSSTFNLPNMNGLFPTQPGAATSVINTLNYKVTAGKISGGYQYTLSESEMPTHNHIDDHSHYDNHTHLYTDPGHTHSWGYPPTTALGSSNNMGPVWGKTPGQGSPYTGNSYTGIKITSKSDSGFGTNTSTKSSSGFGSTTSNSGSSQPHSISTATMGLGYFYIFAN